MEPAKNPTLLEALVQTNRSFKTAAYEMNMRRTGVEAVLAAAKVNPAYATGALLAGVTKDIRKYTSPLAGISTALTAAGFGGASNRFDIAGHLKSQKTALDFNVKMATTISSPKFIKTADITGLAVKMATPKDIIGAAIGVSGNQQLQLDRQLAKITNVYASVRNNFDAIYASMPKFPDVLKIPAQDYFATTGLVKSVSSPEPRSKAQQKAFDEIVYENEFSLSAWLPQLSPDLYIRWKGGLEAFHSENYERCRQFCATARELIIHVLDEMAPESEVASWLEKNKGLGLKKDEPHKIKLNYILRHVSADPMKIFIKTEIDATLSLVRILNEGVHAKGIPFTSDQLNYLKAKAELALRSLLTVHFQINKRNRFS